jgi:hypothetical protein
MVDLVVPAGVDSTTLIEAATALAVEAVSTEDREWSEWAKRRDLHLKDLRASAQPAATLAAPKDGALTLTPLLRIVREAEEEEDQWLQTLREALGSHPSGDSDSPATDPSAGSILDVLAAAPTQKLVSRRASSHVTEASVVAPAAGASKTVAGHHLKKRSSVAHSASSSSLVPVEGKSAQAPGAGSGKEVKSFFENFLSPAAGSGGSQKK